MFQRKNPPPWEPLGHPLQVHRIHGGISAVVVVDPCLRDYKGGRFEAIMRNGVKINSYKWPKIHGVLGL